MAETPTYSLVSCSDNTQHSEVNTQQYQPGLSDESHRLHQYFSSNESKAEHLHFLDGKIVRNPKDILSHTKRITAFVDEGNREGCFDALVDLNIALGSQGYELRKSLLSQALSILSDTQRAFIYHHLKTGLTPSDHIAGLRDSLLSNQIQGSTEFVRRLSAENIADQSPLEQAISARANSDYLIAQNLLENLVLADPKNAEATIELLSLYQEQSMQLAFQQTYAQLIGRQFALPELWDKVRQHFRETTGSSMDNAKCQATNS
ncbi:MAG: hypothetical protein ACWA44_15145 [Thiotrichales bacterium]